MDIMTTVRSRTPSLPFEAMANAVLGSTYELSLVICGDRLARRINTEHRKKTYKPNVLSFPLSRTEGEIFLNVRKAEREAAALGTSAQKRMALLFVHGLLHLKGLDHGDTMEREEEKILAKFRLL